MFILSRDDLSMINADFATIFSNLPLVKINLMEVYLLKIFNFSVEITCQEYEKMNKTIQDLNNAASVLRLRMNAPLHSPCRTFKAGVSISGRVGFPRDEITQNTIDDVCSEDLGVFPIIQGSEALHSPTETQMINSLTTQSNSFSSHDLLDCNSQIIQNVVIQQLENHSEESSDDLKPTHHKQRRSIHVSVDNALGILMKYFPTPHSAKVFITNEDPN